MAGARTIDEPVPAQVPIRDLERSMENRQDIVEMNTFE
jgi:hypothetical protein